MCTEPLPQKLRQVHRQKGHQNWSWGVTEPGSTASMDIMTELKGPQRMLTEGIRENETERKE